MKKIIAIVAIALFVVFVAFRLKGNKEIINETVEAAFNAEIYTSIPVKVHQVNPETLANSVVESGNFKSRQELTVNSSAAGQILRLNAKEGQYVQKGAVIAQLDHAALKSQLSTAQIALNSAIRDAQRFENANQAGALTKLQVDQSKLAIENAKSNVEAIQQQIKNYSITAPMSGYINKLYVEQGTYLMPGAPILELVDVGTLKLVVKVDERLVPLIRAGKSINITTDVYPDKKFSGIISRVGLKADRSQKFEVEINVNNAGNLLKSGMYGKAYFENLSSTNAIYIPRTSIVGSIQDAKVFIVQKDSTVKAIPVETGGYIGNTIQITSGLNNGDKVVTMGQINLNEGSKVSIVE